MEEKKKKITINKNNFQKNRNIIEKKSVIEKKIIADKKSIVEKKLITRNHNDKKLENKNNKKFNDLQEVKKKSQKENFKSQKENFKSQKENFNSSNKKIDSTIIKTEKKRKITDENSIFFNIYS